MLAEDHEATPWSRSTAPEPRSATTTYPCRWFLVALWRDEKLLPVFDRRRQHWELPGGPIEPGETLHQAALRELHEEDTLDLTGYAQFRLGPEHRVEHRPIRWLDVRLGLLSRR